MRSGYRIPKKANNTTPATPNNIEDGELVPSEDETPTPQIANRLGSTKRSRSESPAKELRRAIELLEQADYLEQQARQLREEAREIRQRYDRYKR